MKHKNKILQSLLNEFVQKTIIVCTILIVALILTLCSKINFQVKNPDTYYYFFCTVSQVYGGFLAILFALLVFRINNIDLVLNNLTNIILEITGKDNCKYRNPLNLKDIYDNLDSFSLNQDEKNLLNTIKKVTKMLLIIESI